MKVIQPKPFHPRKTLFVLAVLIIFGVITYTRNPAGPKHIHWQGSTMGTTYNVRVAHSPLKMVEARRLHQEIDLLLRQINDEMSTYIADSEISLFNRSRTTESFNVSPSFAYVVNEARRIAGQTGGAFDPTLDPLLALWGFGIQTKVHTQEPPSPEDLATVMSKIGYMRIQPVDDRHIRKLHPDIQLNLNAIAKGYGVDAVSALIVSYGATNVFVEIGGEVKTTGVNRESIPWRVGIENPDPDAAPGTSLLGVASLSGKAMASSGDYRNFRQAPDGTVYAHILDPRTGRPASHALASVSVIAPTCMEADAIATALYVMGREEGLSWVEMYPQLEALFIERRDDGSLVETYSSGFRAQTGFTRINDN